MNHKNSTCFKWQHPVWCSIWTGKHTAGPCRALHCSAGLGTWAALPRHSRVQPGHTTACISCSVLVFASPRWAGVDLLILALPEVDVLMDTANTLNKQPPCETQLCYHSCSPSCQHEWVCLGGQKRNTYLKSFFKPQFTLKALTHPWMAAAMGNLRKRGLG